MAWKNYNFHFLNTVSQQLVEELTGLPVTALNDVKLGELGAFQVRINSSQGVYLLYFDDVPVYLGKAADIRERLAQHLNKLTGRLYGPRRINLDLIGFKALLLDQSMSTAANEDVLIAFFQQDHKGLWNGRGFGPKDPGKNRDTTKPSYFDQTYPIDTAFPVDDIPNNVTVQALFLHMKKALPYVFRYQKLPKTIGNIEMDLTGIDRGAGTLLRTAMAHFPPGWHAAMVSFGMVVYPGSKAYWHTTEVIVSPGSPPPPPPITDYVGDEDEEEAQPE